MQLFSINPSTRSVCLSVCCAVLFCTLPAISADLTDSDLAYIDAVSPDSETAIVVRSLLASPTSTSSGNITNDVAQILSILRSLVTSQSNHPVLYTYPTLAWTSGTSLPLALALLLSDKDNTSRPTHSDSYLYQIREILKTFPTNTTDQLTDVSSYLQTIIDTLSHTDDTLDWIVCSLTYSSSMWHAHLDDDQVDEIVGSLDDINATMGYGFDALSSALNTGLSSVDLTPVTSRLDAQRDRETYANQIGQTDAVTLNSQVQQADTEDWDTITDTDHDTLQEYESEPTMPDYTPASDADTADANKDRLLDSLGNDALYHSPILTLVSSSDFQTATGVSGSMTYNLAEGPVYTFVGNLGDICSAAWYGLLAVMSALLFWRKQNEISGIVRATNFSRV